MTDIQFYKSFRFYILRYSKYHMTDNTLGCPVHYLARMVKGTAKICSFGVTLNIKPNDVFYIPKGLKYKSYWYPDANGEIEFYSFGFSYFPKAESNRYVLQNIDCTDEEIGTLSLLESDISVSPLSVGRLYTFLGQIMPKLGLDNISGREATVDKAIEIMRSDSDINMCTVAQMCGISESGLYVTFKNILGKTPGQIRQKLVVEKAIELLTSTDISIEEVSSRLGFSSSSYFRKILRIEKGKTPRQIRKEAGVL